MRNYIIAIAIIISGVVVGGAIDKIAANNKWSQICGTQDGFMLAQRNYRGAEGLTLRMADEFLDRACVEFYRDNSFLPFHPKNPL